MKSRRAFLKTGASVAATSLLLQRLPAFGTLRQKDEKDVDTVMTVNGPQAATTLGRTLSHEHIMVDFVGAHAVSPSRYKESEVIDKASPYLVALRKLGWGTVVDCTPAYLGRDAKILKSLSESTALNIITNTGYYGAANEKYVPQHAYTETASGIAERWINEFKSGIENTGVRPGFIKCAVDKYPLSPVQRKLIEAAAITHRETGLTIGVHTGDGKAAMEQLSILRQQGVSPSAWIWIHAQNETNRLLHLKAAVAGGRISFDGYSEKETDSYIRFLRDMKSEGLLSRLLLSHDAGWYHVGESLGGNFVPFTAISEHLVPAMLKASFTEAEIELIFARNPAVTFTIKKRPVAGH
jgi:predicted metal-dependent phosphotriesterase family hydrolase